MAANTLHLIAPAGSCRSFLSALGLESAARLRQFVQDVVGPRYRVQGDAALIEAGEDELHGGRDDDARRAKDIENALGDDEVVAVISLRGGAWFARVLPLIDFSVLQRRRRPVVVFGFSELTPLINIVAAGEHGLGVYDMGPAFLRYGLRRYAEQVPLPDALSGMSAKQWMQQRLLPEFEEYLKDVVRMLEGRGSNRPLTAQLVHGQLPDSCEATFVGGNLVLLSTLAGSPYGDFVRPIGRWLVLEEINEKPERLDRFLSHLTLAGWWDQCAGVLLGNFHRQERDLTQAVIELLPYHLPPGRPIPVLVSRQIGHIWPMSPLPLHQALTIERYAPNSFTISWPTETLRVASALSHAKLWGADGQYGSEPRP